MSAPGGPVTNTYFPTLVDIIKKDPTAIHRLDLGCLLCKDKMAADPENEFPDPPTDADLRSAPTILPCGHMFCVSCLSELITHNIANRCGCIHGEGALFRPRKEQDENLLIHLKAEVSRAYCRQCRVAPLLAGLIRIALYLHRTDLMIRDGHVLAVTVMDSNRRLRYVGGRKEDIVGTLPLSQDLLELYTMAANSFAKNNGDPVPADGSCPYTFELSLCKMGPRDREDVRDQQRELDYVDVMLETSGKTPYELAEHVATKLYIAFWSEGSFSNYLEELYRNRCDEAGVVLAAHVARTARASEAARSAENDEILMNPEGHYLPYLASEHHHLPKSDNITDSVQHEYLGLRDSHRSLLPLREARFVRQALIPPGHLQHHRHHLDRVPPPGSRAPLVSGLVPRLDPRPIVGESQI
ncbi:hypothetical protein FBEOM_13570 [Fusarium beomiforme]|uniref:RING-type domain-containing protein n=1 Tax=Fusarium beomiforme TaxID=44412 RepID=A0A9P5DRG1_9HYPO|nr:hypothetical protein FBEOM_13570 [Fusarium beomiforme]